MKLALMSIGIPGSGKTTLLKPFAETHDITYINRDDIRIQLFGDPLTQANKYLVWIKADLEAEKAFRRGKSVLLDSLFAEQKKRQDSVARIRELGADRVIGIVFSTPLEVALERNRSRKNVVKEEVIEDYYHQLKVSPPSLADGFDALYTSDQMGEIEKRELPKITT